MLRVFGRGADVTDAPEAAATAAPAISVAEKVRLSIIGLSMGKRCKRMSAYFSGFGVAPE
jgi:hypothetical protein